MISTAWPRISSSRLKPKITSPRPPACATGAHSEATITMYIQGCRTGVELRPGASQLSTMASQTAPFHEYSIDRIAASARCVLSLQGCYTLVAHEGRHLIWFPRDCRCDDPA